MSFITLLVWFGLVGPTPPYGLLSDMASGNIIKNCHFFNHLLMVPLPTSNLSAIACKVIPVALISLACSRLSSFAVALVTPLLSPPIRPFSLVSR